MKIRLGLLVFVCLFLPIGLLGGLAPAAAQPEVRAARIGETQERTRFVLELSESVPYRVFTLPDPFRVVVDLPEMAWVVPENRQPKVRGLITGLRFGLFAPGTSRVVLDVSQPSHLQKVFVIPPSDGKPYRLVVDLKQVSREQYFAAAGKAPTGGPGRTTGAAPGKRQSGPTVATSRQPLGAPTAGLVPRLKPKPPSAKPVDARPLIVVDPGHGGVDPGAIGVSGAYEKNIALDYGRALKRALEATGRYRAVLTRDRDVFLKLRERIAFAQKAKGDLFISLHANIHRSGKIRGASVYTLSETASDKEAAAIAAAENAADVLAGVDLTDQTGDVRDILIDLAQRETMNLSKKFANDLVVEVGRDVKLLRNTHRFAGFAVLKSPTIPSVLFEIGYMSNRQEERLLRGKAHRDKVVVSIIRAIDGFFRKQNTANRS
ncbi:N-acetylmuramoyl-L-alanine amidase [Pelagibius litoralis]|uniref:N-acetylmuramoyl-L-alanine amidase n=1 Tax=Pelagibius litoralis TaxID=374515 RepID=A0A967EWW9_9PROT|nr:N-acetylmuramoyl-L-alanine amidase [Pelagibius litoralis]NIA68778.1 N-acetylmuramoyl-L-alanine amidase [Pelagibius litoralis]